MQRNIYLTCIVLLISANPGIVAAQLPDLSPQTVKMYRAAIEPTAEETRFLNIDWRAELANAVADAYELEKPLLIYVMNGHPLGCT